MLLIMSATLFLGACVMIVFFARHAHRFNRHVAAAREHIRSEARSIVEASSALDLKLVEWLLEGTETQSAVDRWQQDRRQLLPGGAWDWNQENLSKRQHEKLQGQLQSLRHRALYTAIIGTVVIGLVFGGVTLGFYAYYSTYQAPANPFDAVGPQQDPYSPLAPADSSAWNPHEALPGAMAGSPATSDTQPGGPASEPGAGGGN